MTLRVLHTADWHLGHSLHDIPREHEHGCFLDWLLETIEAQRIDALLIAGDIFDVANPSAVSQRQWFRFLAHARERFPTLDIVATAGNHDSAARFEAPGALFEAQRIRVVGRLPRNEDRELDLERLLAPLHDAEGEVAAWVVAVPFLRPADLPRIAEADDPLIEGVRAVYQEALAGGLARREEGQALLAMGHCYMKTASLCDLSERKILGGNQHALPADIFDESVDYVALGHLHFGQTVARREWIRYSGAPIALSMAEAGYRHQVCVPRFDDGKLVHVETLEIPRAVGLMRIPEDGPGEKHDVLEQLEALEQGDDPYPPYLEVRVRLERPDGSLRREVTDALEGKNVRLVKLTVEHQGSGRSLADGGPDQQLQELRPEEVFRQLHQNSYAEAPSEKLMAAFHEILEAVEGS